MLTKFVEELFGQYKVKKQNHWREKGRYEELTWTPYLKEVDYLNELIDDATRKDQREMVGDYLARMQADHNIYEVKRYVDVSMNLIDGRRW
jgi:hypothetical protein